MTYPLVKLAHLIGLALMSAGLIGVFVSDLRSRQLRDLPLFAEAIRSIAVFYDGLVVPGALLLLGSGVWLIVTVYGGSANLLTKVGKGKFLVGADFCCRLTFEGIYETPKGVLCALKEHLLCLYLKKAPRT